MPTNITPDVLQGLQALYPNLAPTPAPNPNGPVITPDLGAPPSGWPSGVNPQPPPLPPPPIPQGAPATILGLPASSGSDPGAPATTLEAQSPQTLAAIAGTQIPPAAPMVGGHIAPPGRDLSLDAKGLAGPQSSYAGAAKPGAAAAGAGGGAGTPAGWSPTTRETETKVTEMTPQQKLEMEQSKSDMRYANQLAEKAEASRFEQDKKLHDIKDAENALKERQEREGTFVTVQKHDEKGRPVFGPDGKPVMELHNIPSESMKFAAEQKRAADEERYKRDKAYAAYDLAISKGVDPDRMWNDKSLFGKITTKLLLALGGLNGSDPMASFYKARDADIAKQREALEGAKNKFDMADSHYNLFIKEGMTPDQATASAKVLANREFQKKLDDEQINRNNTGLGKLALAKMQAEHAQQQQKDLLEEAKAFAPVITHKATEKYHAAQAAGAAGEANYKKYVDEWLKGNQAVPLQSRQDWDRIHAGGGEGPHKPPTGGSTVDITGIGKAGEKANEGTNVTTGLADWARHKSLIAKYGLPLVAPGTAASLADVDNYRSLVRGTLKQLEPRLTDHELDTQVQGYVPLPTDSDELKKQKLQNFEDRAATGAETRGKTVIQTDAD